MPRPGQEDPSFVRESLSNKCRAKVETDPYSNRVVLFQEFGKGGPDMNMPEYQRVEHSPNALESVSNVNNTCSKLVVAQCF